MRPPHVLAVNAFDPTGASGLQADLKTLTALGVYGSTALTGVHSEAPIVVGTEQLRAQLRQVLGASRPDAVKIGEVGTAALAGTIADELSAAPARRIVLDAVMVDGDDVPRATAEAAAVIRTRLVPLASVLVANLLEAAQLLDRAPATDIDGLAEQATALRDHGPVAVLVTGARLGGEDALDVLAHPGGVDVLRGERAAGAGTRGAGATLSASIAAQYARLAEFDRAGELAEIGEKGEADDDVTIIASAREFVASAIAHAQGWDLLRSGSGRRGPVNHLITLDRA